MKPAPNASRAPLKSQRGSLLIVAMILCAIIGIALVSYIQVGRTALKLSNRSLYNNAAMNFAEQGLEEAVFAINQMVADPGYSWSGAGWSVSGGNAQRKWTNVPLSQNTTGEYRVYISGYNSTAPIIISRSIIKLADASSAPIEKWVRVTLGGSSRYANGLVAKNSVLFKGNNASVDSFHSTRNDDGSLRASPVGYSSAVRRDRGTVGSISVATDAVLVKQADVWGYVSTGGTDPTSSVGKNGSILGADSSYDPDTWTSTKVDPERVSTTFSASFDPETQPTSSVPTLGSVTSPTTLGTAGGATTIVCSSISLSGNGNVVKFQGDVTLLITAPAGGTAIKISGNNSGITILANSSLKIYTAGDIDLTGQGVGNQTGFAKNFEIIGTSTSSAQDIKIAGGGNFVGKIYAPNADVTINGDGSMIGSVVADNITLTGNAAFHYDEALGEPEGTSPYRVSKWEELTTAASRTAVAAHLEF